jgi:predicted nucleic acid-binding protein
MDTCDLAGMDEKIRTAGMQEYLSYYGFLLISDAMPVAVMKTGNISRIVSFDADFDKVDGIVKVHRP